MAGEALKIRVLSPVGDCISKVCKDNMKFRFSAEIKLTSYCDKTTFEARGF